MGLPGLTSLSASVAVGEWVVGGFLAAVALTFAVTRRRLTRFESFAVLAMVLSGLAVLVSPEFYQYYAYFPLVFASLVVGICAGRWVALGARVTKRTRSRARFSLSRVTARRASAAAVVGVLAFVVVAVVLDASATSTYVLGGQHDDPAALLSTYVPQGSCVISDSPAILIASDLFSAQRAGCPLIVDSYGTWLSADPAQPAPDPGSDVPGLASQWRSWMSEAQYVVLSVQGTDFIPWDARLTSWFSAHYVLIASEPGATVYIHVHPH